MLHLDSDSLARLGSEIPSADERAHLQACVQCARAVAQLRRQCAALRVLPPLVPPPAAWSAISTALTRHSTVSYWKARMRLVAAAAVLCFAIGGAAGAGILRWHQSRPDSADAGARTLASDPHQAIARLAALETMLFTTEAALRDVPDDALLSRYRTSVLRERSLLLSHVRLTSSHEWY